MNVIEPPDNSSLYRTSEGYRRVMAHYDACFGRMGVAYESAFVDTRYGTTHAVICGNEGGKQVVLWHGGNANSTASTRWIAHLTPTYRVYAVDTIGEMGKSAPTRPSRAGPAYGEWAADALEGLGLEQANMVGVSNGAWLILKLAGVAPQRIGSATLVSAAGFQPVSWKFILRFMVVFLTRPPAETPRRFWDILTPPDIPPDPGLLRLFELMLGDFRIGFRGPPVVSAEEAGRLTAPTYLLIGEHEATFDPYKTVRRALRLLPNVTAAEIVPGVGHLMVHRQPAWVTERISSFLERYAV
jgi:pimeloyl-ACP methyl ester carboxylesterase